MRKMKVLALAVVVTLSATLALAVPVPEPPQSAIATSGLVKAGTVLTLDHEAKLATIKAVAEGRPAAPGEAAGEISLYWDAATRIEGELKQGASVRYTAVERNGKTVATWIEVGKPKGM